MKIIKRMTFLNVILLILATAMNFTIEWKIIVIAVAAVDLAMIVWKVSKR